MKILDIERYEFEYHLRVDDIDKVDYILVDNTNNIKNVESNLDNAHTIKITKFTKDADNDRIIVLTDEFYGKVDVSCFIVTLRSFLTEYDKPFNPYFYYDKAEVFYKMVELPLLQCEGCLDKQQKEKILIFILRKNLLETAQKLNKINDCVKYYGDLARILNIDTTNLNYHSSYLRHGRGPSTTGHIQYITQLKHTKNCHTC